MERENEEKKEGEGRSEEKGEQESINKIFCDGCVRILAIWSENTVFVQEAHLDKCPRYEAPNHFMAPWYKKEHLNTNTSLRTMIQHSNIDIFNFYLVQFFYIILNLRGTIRPCIIFPFIK